MAPPEKIWFEATDSDFCMVWFGNWGFFGLYTIVLEMESTFNHIRHKKDKIF